MSSTDTALHTITRPPLSEDEIGAFYQLLTRTFMETDDPVLAVRARRRDEEEPGFAAEWRRAVFIGDTLVGGHLAYERDLRIDAAHLCTACIGGVATVPEYRRKGVAKAMLRDTVDRAVRRRCALLLLDGIENFYHRFGFVDVFDRTDHVIDPSGLPALPHGYITCRATFGDAPVLLDLYRRHYGPYTGSFARTLKRQQHLLRYQILNGNPPILAVNPNGQVEGYLQLARAEAGVAQAREAAADSREATLALLGAHRQALSEGVGELRWPLPPDSPTYYFLADQIPGTERFGRRILLCSEQEHGPNAGWMARAGHLPALLEALLPAWQERWTRQGGQEMIFTLQVGNTARSLRLATEDVQLLDREPGAPLARFTPETLTQLLFGYRPVSWAAVQPGCSVPDETRDALDTLFPLGHIWIAGSDAF